MRTMLFGTLILALCLSGAALRADTESTSALYLLGGVDGKLLTNTDADNYFGVSSDLLGPKGYASPVVHLGLQIERWMAVELSGNFGPYRYNQVSYSSDGGLSTRQITAQWDLDTYSITPALTWAGLGFVNFLGLRVGMANLYGHVEDDADGADGSYDQRATTPDIGVLFRTSQIFVDHFSIGLELGYDHTVFNYITNQNGAGTYADVSSPEHNVSSTGHNGPQTTLDFSGPHIAIIVGLWTSAPVHEVGEPEDSGPVQ